MHSLGHDRQAQPDPRRPAQAAEASEQLGPAARHCPRGEKQAGHAEDDPDPAAPPNDHRPRARRPRRGDAARSGCHLRTWHLAHPPILQRDADDDHAVLEPGPRAQRDLVDQTSDREVAGLDDADRSVHAILGEHLEDPLHEQGAHPVSLPGTVAPDGEFGCARGGRRGRGKPEDLLMVFFLFAGPTSPEMTHGLAGGAAAAWLDRTGTCMASSLFGRALAMVPSLASVAVPGSHLRGNRHANRGCVLAEMAASGSEPAAAQAAAQWDGLQLPARGGPGSCWG
jgi:hypothetical protein